MTERLITYPYRDHIENSLLMGHAKETAIINNNLLSYNRAFGTDISNLRVPEPKAAPSYRQSLNIQPLAIDDFESFGATRVPDSFRNDTYDSSLAELPKTTRDPLLASRELLTLKLNPIGDRASFKIDNQPKRAQKVSMNLFAMENCDILEINNPQYVSGYAKEIFEHLSQIEEKYYAKYGYIAQLQTEINEKMRAILIDWLVDIHIKFKLLPETLYIAINLIDRYLEKEYVPKSKLQLVGITAMMIAAKYQEIYPPQVKDFVYVADKAYRREDLLDMEGKILSCLKFHLSIPSALTFLERYTRLVGMDKKAFYLCQYIVEMALIDYKNLRYRPSLIVCGAIQLANRTLRKQVSDDVLLKNANYSEEIVGSCTRDLLASLKNTEKLSLRAVKRKFLSTQYFEVSKITIG